MRTSQASSEILSQALRVVSASCEKGLQNLSRVHQGRLSLSSIATLSHDGTFVRFLKHEKISQTLRVFLSSCEKGLSSHAILPPGFPSTAVPLVCQMPPQTPQSGPRHLPSDCAAPCRSRVWAKEALQRKEHRR